MLQNLVQERVDFLAHQLQRSVAVDDVHINLLAASKHFDDADAARVRAILARTLDPQSCDYLFSFGIATTQETIVRIPSCEALGIRERSCYPIRWEDETLGYVWLIESVTPKEDAAAVACASELAVALFGMRLEHEKEYMQRELIVRDLFSVDSRRVARAAYLLSRQRLLNIDLPYRVCCAVLQTNDERYKNEAFTKLRARFTEWMTPTNRNELATCPLLFSQLATELLILVPAVAELTETDYLMNIIERSMLPSVRIGIGANATPLHLYDSYMQATSVVQILQAIPSLGSFSTWEGLGVYVNLALALTDRQGGIDIPMTPKISLLAQEGSDLLQTLETFLDNAGNVARTAQQLCIHRSTLYYRLSRIMALTGTDIDSGIDRLTLHLEAKLWRLTNAIQQSA